MRRLACRKRCCILGFTRNPPCFVGWVLVHCPLYPRKQSWFRVFLRNQSEGFASIRTRQSFESAVSESRFHDLKPDKAVLTVCLVPERDRGLDLNAIHGKLPPLLETIGDYEPEADRHTEISLAEGLSWKSVLDID